MPSSVTFAICKTKVISRVYKKWLQCKKRKNKREQKIFDKANNLRKVKDIQQKINTQKKQKYLLLPPYPDLGSMMKSILPFHTNHIQAQIVKVYILMDNSFRSTSALFCTLQKLRRNIRMQNKKDPVPEAC